LQTLTSTTFVIGAIGREPAIDFMTAIEATLKVKATPPCWNLLPTKAAS
jgi:hypothetical protein